MNSNLIAEIIVIVGCLNILLSAVQQIFAKLSQQEPSWLVSVSKVVLSVVQYLGSNPPNPPAPPAAS
jgi:hypothetical protein